MLYFDQSEIAFHKLPGMPAEHAHSELLGCFRYAQHTLVCLENGRGVPSGTGGRRYYFLLGK